MKKNLAILGLTLVSTLQSAKALTLDVDFSQNEWQINLTFTHDLPGNPDVTWFVDDLVQTMGTGNPQVFSPMVNYSVWWVSPGLHIVKFSESDFSQAIFAGEYTITAPTIPNPNDNIPGVPDTTGGFTAAVAMIGIIALKRRF